MPDDNNPQTPEPQTPAQDTEQPAPPDVGPIRTYGENPPSDDAIRLVEKETRSNEG
jgi:hypothetical protein